MNRISTDARDFIQEIDQLWEPVYPYLAEHIREAYGREDGVILEMGPFCGVIFSLRSLGVGNRFIIGAFPSGMATFYRKCVLKKGLEDCVTVFETDEPLSGLKDASVDLIVFRGALFFPSLFRVDYGEIWRVIRPGGVAMIGGGFGKFTPPEIIRSIGDRSRELNLRLGKVEITTEQVRNEIHKNGLPMNYRIVEEGGLWVILGKT